MLGMEVWIHIIPFFAVLTAFLKGTQHLNVYNANVTIITSPGFPANYPDNTSIEWEFTAAHGEKISFTMLDIDTEYGYDVVKLFDMIEDNDGKEPILATMSGDKSNQVVISNKEQMRVKFMSDSNTNGKGFKALVIAVMKTDIPELEWIDFSNLKIKFPNGGKEIIQLKQIASTKRACIFLGITDLIKVIITSPLSMSDKCQSFDQNMEISINSDYLKNNKATYALKNGQLEELNDHIFVDNVIKWRSNLINTKYGKLRSAKTPKLIQIPIQFGYDKGLYHKFSKYGQEKGYIEKRIEEIFHKSKWSLMEMLNNTNIELLLHKNILFVNEVLEMDSIDLHKCRKYQHNEEVPLVMLVEEDHHNNIKGLSFRSGACRKDTQRYGVALVSWRDDGSLAGDVLAHELGHLIGGIHIEGNQSSSRQHEVHDNKGETHVGSSENVKFWFNSHGNRCYGKNCSLPSTPPNGNWLCDDEYLRCDLKCSGGFISIFSTIHCQNGKWSEDIDVAVCSPSVLLMAGGGVNQEHMHSDSESVSSKYIDIYDATCLDRPPRLVFGRIGHTSSYHEGTLYFCGGTDTESICTSTDSQTNKWRTHILAPGRSGHSSVVMRNKLYLIGGHDIDYNYLSTAWTTLPLTEIPDWTPVYNVSYKGEDQCVVKIDETIFIITGSWENKNISRKVTKYNVADGIIESLAPMKRGRYNHGCIAVEKRGKTWIVVSGGVSTKVQGQSLKREVLKSTMILDISGRDKKWKKVGNLRKRRYGHGMAVTKKGVIVMGGYNLEVLKSVELLMWKARKWRLIKPNIKRGRSSFGGVVQIPSKMFRCNVDLVTDCPALPLRTNGKWNCDSENSASKCSLICDPGFVSSYTDTICSDGSWEYVSQIECLESVILLSGGYSVEIFDMNRNSDNITCSNPPPVFDREWTMHATFSHQRTLYMCGGRDTDFLCVSYNARSNIWRKHELAERRWDGHSALVMKNKLYLIGGRDYESGITGKAIWTTLPFTDKPDWANIPNFSYKGSYQCVVKIDQDNFVITAGRRNAGGYFGRDTNKVIRYNIVNETMETLFSMINGRYYHGCTLVKKSRKDWILIIGGQVSKDDRDLSSTEKLDLSGKNKKWESSGELNIPRSKHGMAFTAKGVIVFGGGNIDGFVKSIELLDWDTDTWHQIKPSLTHGRNFMNAFVEIPAELFGCQTQPITITDCSGEYEYNKTYVGGEVTPVPENETCHSVCQNDTECIAWTWTEVMKCYIIRPDASLDTPQIQFQVGSVSGFRDSCKPKCYLVVDDREEVSTSTQICHEEKSEKGCVNIIYMEPGEFNEEDRDKILVCFEVEKRVLCENITLDAVNVICNPEPGIVTLSTYQKINKHFFTRHLGPSFHRWG